MFLSLGDSYTIGEGVPVNERWPCQLAELWNANGSKVAKPTIIATTGWRTDNLINAISIAQLRPVYDLVSLLIGVNNQYQQKPIGQFEIDFVRLIEIAIHLAKDEKRNVFVVSIPDYGYTPFGIKSKKAISGEINQFNDCIQRICQTKGIAWVDITDISREGLTDASLLADDGLHPSGKMYKLWAQRVASNIKF